jgi:acetyl-CoA acetyltransferase
MKKWLKLNLTNSAFGKLRLCRSGAKNHGNWSCKSNSKALKQAGLTLNDIDLIELNEALLHKR